MSGNKYYVANNLKLCEFFNAAAGALTEEERKKWYIRIVVDDERRNDPLKIADEAEVVEESISYDNFKLLIDEDDSSTTQSSTSRQRGGHHRNTDYLKLGKQKKQLVT